MGIVAGIYAALLAGLYAAFGVYAVAGAAPALVVVVVLMPLLRYVLARRNVYGKSGSRIYDDARTLQFSVEGFLVRTEGGVESRVPWTHIERVERRGPFTLLFMTKIQHFIVPDSAFATEPDRRTFDLLLETRGLVKA